MNIAFIWNFDKASSVFENWRDGLRSALDLIAVNHNISWYLDKHVPTKEYDFYLVWDDSNTDTVNRLPKGKKGICLTTNPWNIDNLKNFDVVFAESEPVYQECRMNGLRTIKAFGTDTDLFVPGKDKDIKYFYPATFSPWKRQSAIAHLGSDLLCVGTVQPDGQRELQECLKHGVQVKEGYYPVNEIADLYKRTEKMIIPAIHGSERTVLEAMSCNILPEVEPSNVKSYSYIEEFKESGFKQPRDFIIKNYSHRVYADKLLKGIND